MDLNYGWSHLDVMVTSKRETTRTMNTVKYNSFLNKACNLRTIHPVGRQRGLVVKRPPGNQEVGGSNPTTAM